MSRSVSKSLLLIFIAAPLFLLGDAQTNQPSVTISLAETNQTSQVFNATVKLSPASKIVIHITDVDRSLEFFLIQVHCFQPYLILSNNTNFPKESYVNGTNIGLVQFISRARSSYDFFLKHENENLRPKVFIAVIPYKKAPIPGGCNMEFMTEIAPYQLVSYTDSVITVDAQSASIKGRKCEMQVVRHEMFHMYFPEADFTPETYFENIQKMLTVDDIYANANPMSYSVSGYLRRMYNSYRGTGTVYAVIAYVNQSKSAYVPVVSYGCDVNNYELSCSGITSTSTTIWCIISGILGLIMCYFGHKLFKLEMFIVGSLIGSYITYLLISVFERLSDIDAVIISLIIGCLFGFVWLAFWWFCGIPVLSTLLSLLILGFLVAATIFYAGLSDLTFLHNDITYWGFFAAIVLLCLTILTSFVHKANILACAVVGAYAFVIPWDIISGSNLKYIFINTIRRATVDNFGAVVIDPPFQRLDLWFVSLWLFLVVSGVALQWKLQKGHPPFPPRYRGMQPPDERTPLLMPTSSVSPADRIIIIHSAPFDV